jgi:hypothetical protein
MEGVCGFVPYPRCLSRAMIILEKRAMTYRARRMLCEPAVDAPDVEVVMAPREQAHHLTVDELAEADGALCPQGVHRPC